MSVEAAQSVNGGAKEPAAENVYERPQDQSEMMGNELEPGEFNVENIERIYRYPGTETQNSPSDLT